jgi:hypothetical protein
MAAFGKALPMSKLTPQESFFLNAVLEFLSRLFGEEKIQPEWVAEEMARRASRPGPGREGSGVYAIFRLARVK